MTERVPAIFRDVTRLLLIAVGSTVIFSYVWGVRVAGLFTAFGVTSVVIGLMLQNSVGQIVSGLFMLFEQPSGSAMARHPVGARTRRGSELARGSYPNRPRIADHPKSVLASTSFTNLSRPPGLHQLAITTTFSPADPPDRVRNLLSRVASTLPQCKGGNTPTAVAAGSGGVPPHHRVEVARR